MVGKPQENEPRESGGDLADSRPSVPDASWRRLTEFIFGNGSDKGRYDSLRRFTLRKMSRRLKTIYDPDEIIHEVCISAHEDFVRLPEDAGLVSWIKKAILNRIRNLGRKLGRQKRRPPRGRVRIRLDPDGREGSPWLQIPSDHPSPEQVVMDQEEVDRIWEKRELLPEEQSALITSVFFRAIPRQRAAFDLGISDARASRLLYKALHDLRGILMADAFFVGGGWRPSKRKRARTPARSISSGRR